MDFAQCLRNAAEMPGFIEQFNRITGYALQDDSSPDSEDALAFALFVEKYIWKPVLEKQGLPFVSQIKPHRYTGRLRVEI
jgi:hypothetical protein